MKSKKNSTKKKFELKSFSEKVNMNEKEKSEYARALRKELKLQSNKIERRFKVIEKHGYKSHEYDIMKSRVKGIKEGYRKTNKFKWYDKPQKCKYGHCGNMTCMAMQIEK